MHGTGQDTRVPRTHGDPPAALPVRVELAAEPLRSLLAWVGAGPCCAVTEGKEGSGTRADAPTRQASPSTVGGTALFVISECDPDTLSPLFLSAFLDLKVSLKFTDQLRLL